MLPWLDNLRLVVLLCVAAAACHFHKNEFEEALGFIDLAEPIIKYNNLLQTTIPKHYNFEEVRIHLWTQMGDHEQLEGYLFNRWVEYLRHYYDAQSEPGGTVNYSAENLLRQAREYENRYYEQVRRRVPGPTREEWVAILQMVVDAMEQ